MFLFVKLKSVFFLEGRWGAGDTITNILLVVLKPIKKYIDLQIFFIIL